ARLERLYERDAHGQQKLYTRSVRQLIQRMPAFRASVDRAERPLMYVVDAKLVRVSGDDAEQFVRPLQHRRLVCPPGLAVDELDERVRDSRPQTSGAQFAEA